MPRRRKPSDDPALKPVAPDILDAFVPDAPLTAQDIEAAMRRFKKALIERALGAELTHHLGYAPGGLRPDETTNHRNGSTAKTVLTDEGTVAIDVPRDREGTFAPVLIPKHERRFTGFDEKILALYARGLTVREIQAFLQEMYAVEVSPDLISAVTDAVVDEITTWQARPLEAVYAVVFFDALRVKIRDEGAVRSKAVYLALAILPDGRRDILGLWIEQTEGAKFWLKVFTDLRARLRGHPDRGHRRVEGDARSARRGVPPHDAANVHRPSDSPQSRLCELAGSAPAGHGPANHLRRADGGSGGCGAGGLRSQSARPTLSDSGRRLAPRLDAGHSVLRVSTGDPPRLIYDQRAGECAPAGAEDH